MAKIFYELKMNNNEDSKIYGKWFAYSKTIETLNTRKLAQHISEHGSIYTPDVVYGVLEKFRSCLLEMLLNSKKVKIEGLGTFYCTLENKKKGAPNKEDYSVREHISGLHIRFLPEQTTEENISSREFLKKAEFILIDSLLPKEKEEEAGGSQSGNGGSQSGNGGSQNQGGGSSQTQGYALTINKTGSGSASVTNDGNAVASGASLNEDDEVEISITPAEGKVPTATLNGSSIELTESDGVYTGNFAMPGQASTLVINTGSAGGGGNDEGGDAE